MAGGGVLQKGIVVEYGTVHTDKNWYQDYKTVYKVTTSASISITANVFVVINKEGFNTTFSDWAGPINEAVISYGLYSVSYGWSTTYTTYGGGIGPGASLPAGTGAYMTGTTTLIGEPRYFVPSYPTDKPRQSHSNFILNCFLQGQSTKVMK